MEHARLLRILRSELDIQQIQLSPYCRQQIEQLIGYGVTRMRADKALETASFVMRAEGNLKALIGYLVKYSKKIGTYPVLGDADFDDAVRKSPAFWPFCMSG